MYPRTRVVSVLLGLAGAAAMAGPAGAQTTGQQQQQQPPTIEERVQVVATRLPEAPHEVPQSVEIFTGEDLRRLGATSLHDALSLATGVAIAPGGDGGPASSVPEFWGLREFDAFLLVVDGIPWGGAFNPALTSLSLRDVERVEVLRGPAPVTFGATSFVGVIHVVHKAASETTRYASVHGGTYGTGGLAVDLAIPSSGAWKSRLTADFERQGFKDDRTSFGRGHALWRTAKVDGDTRTWFMADVNILRQDPGSPHPRQGTRLSPLVPLDANHNPADAFLNSNRFTGSYGTERALGDKRLAITASFSHTGQENFRGYLAEVAPGPDNAVGFRQKIDQTDLYADAHLVWPEFRNVRFVAGADWLHGNGDSKGEVFDYTVPLSGVVGVDVPEPDDLPIGSEDRRDFLGGYALAEWRPTPRVTVSGGLRLNITTEEREEGEEEGAKPAEEEGKDSQNNVRPSGNLGVLVSLWEQGTNHVRAFANYRNTFKPAVFDFGLGEGEEEGGLLDPETSQSIEGGVKTRFMDGRVDVEASLFRMNFTNLVTSTVVDGLPALLNAGETRFQGFEIASDVRGPHAVSGRITYSFHDATFVDFEQSFDGVVTQLAGNRFEMSPRHLFTLGAFYAPAQGVFGDVVIRYTGDRYLDKRNRALADAFSTVDIGVGYRMDRYELRLDGRNLTDARDPVSESEVGDAQYYRMTARQVRLTLGVRF